MGKRHLPRTWDISSLWWGWRWRRQRAICMICIWYAYNMMVHCLYCQWIANLLYYLLWCENSSWHAAVLKQAKPEEKTTWPLHEPRRRMLCHSAYNVIMRVLETCLLLNAYVIYERENGRCHPDGLASHPLPSQPFDIASGGGMCIWCIWYVI